MMESISLSDDEVESSDSSWDATDPRYDVPATPTSTTDSEPPSAAFGTHDDSDEEDAARERGELVPRRKPGGYDSRIEQILYENPELPILITDAGKSPENGGRYIVYTIRTDVRQGPRLLEITPLWVVSFSNT